MCTIPLEVLVCTRMAAVERVAEGVRQVAHEPETDQADLVDQRRDAMQVLTLQIHCLRVARRLESRFARRFSMSAVRS
jgi:hypothetical protein